MLESTLRLIPEPTLQNPEAGLQRPETALLGFGPDMFEEIRDNRRPIETELESQGIIYDPRPKKVPAMYSYTPGGNSILSSAEAAQKVASGEWSGADLANNLLKGMYWARLESSEPGPIESEQARVIGAVIGAVYQANHGSWGERSGDDSKRSILLHSHVEGQHERLLIRGSDAEAGYVRDMVDVRSYPEVIGVISQEDGSEGADVQELNRPRQQDLGEIAIAA